MNKQQFLETAERAANVMLISTFATLTIGTLGLAVLVWETWSDRLFQDNMIAIVGVLCVLEATLGTYWLIDQKAQRQRNRR